MAFTDVAYRKRKKGARKIDRNREDCEQIVSKKKEKYARDEDRMVLIIRTSQSQCV